MENYLLDWATLLLRGVHVITATAWIGASFYFVFLDSSLTPPVDEALKKQGVSGELWAVHGGGFYHPVKFAVAPAQLPERLHWFFWESYGTWISGFALFALSYLYSARTYLIDKSRVDWEPATAIGVALAFLVLFWLFYDAICRFFGPKKNADAIVGALVCLLVGLASWLACRWFAGRGGFLVGGGGGLGWWLAWRWFAGRAAFVLVGAMMATAMSANVFFWIIPGQRRVLAQIRAGQPVDPVHGQRGKQRSVHNTYFTLPVLLAMLSNHYSFTWSHPHNAWVLILMMFAGAAIRQFFVLRHGHRLGRNGNPLPYALLGVAVIAGVIVWIRPAPQAVPALVSAAVGGAEAGAGGPNGYASVQQVLAQRCYLCHGAQLQMKNLRLDLAASVRQHAQAIYQQTGAQKLMPMNNATGMTEAERALIGRWFEAGAPMP